MYVHSDQRLVWLMPALLGVVVGDGAVGKVSFPIALIAMNGS